MNGDAFKLCCWRRLLRVSWTARRSNQSILGEIDSEYTFDSGQKEKRVSEDEEEDEEEEGEEGVRG